MKEAISSCDIPLASTSPTPTDFIEFQNFKWSGRDVQEYKPEYDSDFKDIIRHELIGNFGESTKFDLRYFEIKPGGYSSLEKHIHEHVIIGARGRGLLLKDGKQIEIQVHDIAYVSPMEKHQLRNREHEPFGFFCIVDHHRDRPIRV